MTLDGVVKTPIHGAVTDNTQLGTHQGPGRWLYIYYLEGVPRPPLKLGADFIGNWQETESAFLFFNKPAQKIVDRLVHNQPHLVLMDHYKMTYAEWQGVSVDGFTVGEIYIRPPWIPSHNNAKVEIILDPGVVFGNGNHTTTQDCLTALQQVWKKWWPQEVLDLGCGTGILALAAACLGADRVLAVDLNRMAVDMTHQNIMHNKLGRQILAVQGRAETMLSRPTDLLIANIHFAVMQQLIRQPAFQQHRHLILSGLLRSELKAVENELATQKIDLLQHWSNDGIWHTILCRPKEGPINTHSTESSKGAF